MKEHPDPWYLIFRGPLGAGKTTLARVLAESTGARVISIDKIIDAWPWDGGSLALFLRANRVAEVRARAALGKGTPVIFEGNFYWDEVIGDLLARLRSPHAVITLRVPLSICIDRDRGRGSASGTQAARVVFAKVRSVRRGRYVDASGSLPQTARSVLEVLREELAPLRVKKRASGARA